MAIIAVLVAIAIPIFTTQLEKSRESTDLANVRAAYAEVQTAVLSEDSSLKQADGTYQIVVSPLKQKVDGWTTPESNLIIGGVPASAWTGSPAANGSCTITVDPSTQSVNIAWSGEAAPAGGGGSASTPSWAGQAMTAEERDSRQSIMAYPSSGTVHHWENGTITAEVNQVYRVQDAYYVSGKPRYLRYDGTNWYGATEVGSAWTLYQP